MMPNTNPTNQTAEAVPGDLAPDSLIFAELFAALTPRERAQVRGFMASLRQKRSA